ncbi:MAG: hypothetical protein M3N49_08740 [Candidatus Eremiobacteraeota bacterium]|nr:hypothetical protein [Candidatus Eremiobacteraeota bacterium]
MNFHDNNGEGDFTITPLAVGHCQITIDDCRSCVSSTVVVLPGNGLSSILRRR